MDPNKRLDYHSLDYITSKGMTVDWIKKYQLFMFDFDGLLVNTEEIHYQAYQNMCAARGYKLDWSFSRYCDIAHRSAENIRNTIYEELPNLHRDEPRWEVLYAEKKLAYTHLLESGAVQMMPGAAQLLKFLAKDSISRCVVTNSVADHVAIIRKQQPVLDTIPHWITRENYTQPKPHPECYEYALHKLASPEDAVIGFEDTPRGLQALRHTKAQPVLVASKAHAYIGETALDGVIHVESFEELL